jgi:hypothetical protein
LPWVGCWQGSVSELLSLPQIFVGALMNYFGVRRRVDDGSTRISFEARIRLDERWRCLGFFSTAEEAARCYNREAAKHGQPLNDNIAPSFRRIRCGDGTITTLFLCGMCGTSQRFGKSGIVKHCGKTYHAPDNLEELPVETSMTHRKTINRVRRRVEREKQKDEEYQLRERIHRMVNEGEEIYYERGKPVLVNRLH